MKFVLLFAVLVALAVAEDIPQSVPAYNTAYNYMERFGIPRAEELQKLEEKLLNKERIVGGVPAALGKVPYQAGLIVEIRGITGRGVCGGSLLTADRVLTAAHCWFDGVHQGWRLTVVLGSIFLFSGGTRIEAGIVALHPNWQPLLIRNDIGVIPANTCSVFW